MKFGAGIHLDLHSQNLVEYSKNNPIYSNEK